MRWRVKQTESESKGRREYFLVLTPLIFTFTPVTLMSTQIEILLPYSQLDLVKNSYISVLAGLRNIW